MAIKIRCIQVYLLEIFWGHSALARSVAPGARVSRWTALGSATRGKSRSLPTRSESSIATLGMTQGRARGRRAGGSEDRPLQGTLEAVARAQHACLPQAGCGPTKAHPKGGPLQRQEEGGVGAFSGRGRSEG